MSEHDATTTDKPDLWCVHVLGMDDLLACKDRTAAIRNAMWNNLSTYPMYMRDGNNRLAAPCWSVPEPWPYSAESHAEDLAERDAEDPRWSGPNDDLAPLAAEVFAR